MTLVKKLIFAPLFLIALTFLLYQLNPLLRSYDFIFAFSASTIIQLIILAALIFLTSLFFVLFASLAYDWKLILPTGILASILPMFFLKQPIGLILSVGALATLILTYLALENTLKTYLNFKPNSLFGPHIRRLSTFLILVISLTYFLSISKTVQETGFQIPDSLLERALKITAPSQESSQQPSSQPSLSKDQIELLKQNPDLLKQYGLDPEILDSLSQPQQRSKAPADLAQDTLKQAVKGQLDTIIKPYLAIIPGVLTILFFFILQSLVALLNLLIYPLLWGIFYILEKTGFVKFTVEQRPVKKIVI